MNKITYLLTTFAFGFYVPTVSGQNPAPATEKPNIVFILEQNIKTFPIRLSMKSINIISFFTKGVLTNAISQELS